MIEQFNKELCPGCLGQKVQTNIECIRVICPVCGGKGYIWHGNFDDLPYGTYSFIKVTGGTAL
jgi:hypothetical protein